MVSTKTEAVSAKSRQRLQSFRLLVYKFISTNVTFAAHRMGADKGNPAAPGRLQESRRGTNNLLLLRFSLLSQTAAKRTENPFKNKPNSEEGEHAATYTSDGEDANGPSLKPPPAVQSVTRKCSALTLTACSGQDPSLHRSKSVAELGSSQADTGSLRRCSLLCLARAGPCSQQQAVPRGPSHVVILPHFSFPFQKRPLIFLDHVGHQKTQFIKAQFYLWSDIKGCGGNTANITNKKQKCFKSLRHLGAARH